MGNNSNPESTPSEQRGDIIERPDGFYWEDRSEGKLYGPFPTLLEAEQDMLYEAESDFEEGETLEEAEAEIGISDWIDPDTGAPAEDATPRRNND
jgi:hypothetical protein